jgi:hypothetical protein
MGKTMIFLLMIQISFMGKARQDGQDGDFGGDGY